MKNGREENIMSFISFTKARYIRFIRLAKCPIYLFVENLHNGQLACHEHIYFLSLLPQTTGITTLHIHDYIGRNEKFLILSIVINPFNLALYDESGKEYFNLKNFMTFHKILVLVILILVMSRHIR